MELKTIHWVLLIVAGLVVGSVITYSLMKDANDKEILEYQSDFPKELRYAENPKYICIQNELFRLYGQLYVIDILDSYDLKLREWCKQEGYVEE